MNTKSLNVISVNARIARSVNRAMILNMIRQMQPISRIRIARLTGLNKSTVSSIVTELFQEDLILEKVNEDQNIGRNPINLSLKLDKFLVGAINIDSSSTRFAIADIDGSIKGTSIIKTTPGNPEKFLNNCIEELYKLAGKLNIKQLDGLGVSIAGIVDSQKLMVKYAPNLGWEDLDIGAILKKKCPDINNIAVGNDAKSSALAELWFGSHNVNLSNFAFISIGPGIGSGIVVEKNLLDGEFHASGEFGHMTLFEDGLLCSCGNTGCWEAYASDRATVKRYIEKKHSKITDSVDVMVQDITDLAKDGDQLSIDILKQTGYYLGLGIVNVIKSVDPHAIIIGGRITNAWDIIYPEIMEVVRKRAFFGKEKNILILPTSLKLRPRLLGAATLAIKMIFDDYKIIA